MDLKIHFSFSNVNGELTTLIKTYKEDVLKSTNELELLIYEFGNFLEIAGYSDYSFVKNILKTHDEIVNNIMNEDNN